MAQSSVLLSQTLIQLANVLRNTALDLLSGVVEFARNARSLLHERHVVRSGGRGVEEMEIESEGGKEGKSKKRREEKS